jgi:hypothetical protein
VLDRIAQALMLTDVEREHLFLLGLGRPPEVRCRKDHGVTPRLQRVLDALQPSPALIRTPAWYVIAWNQAATVLLTDYGALPAEQRNILRYIFLDPAARAGAAAEVEPLVDELCRLSPEFHRCGAATTSRVMARRSNTSSTRCSGRLPGGLQPATAADAEKIASLT